MDLSDVKMMQAICDVGSLSRAGDVLHMSQPTLSKKLARLEDKLAAKLFHRSATGLVPTDVTKYVLSKSEPLQARIQEIERHVELMTNLEAGNINIGVGPIIEQMLLPTVLRRFADATRHVEVSIVTEDADTLLHLLNTSQLDIIVGPFRAQDYEPKAITAKPLVKDAIIAVARAGHPIFKTRKNIEDRLADFPLVAPKAQGATKSVTPDAAARDPDIACDNYGLLKKHTLATDSVCAGPRAVFREELESGALKEIKVDMATSWEGALLIRPETLETPLAKLLVELFEDESKKHNNA